MRKIILTFTALALFLVAPDLSATEIDVKVPAAEVTTHITTADAPAAGELQLTKIQLEQSASADDIAAAQFQRGSFWWIVAAIVVGGVILAVVL